MTTTEWAKELRGEWLQYADDDSNGKTDANWRFVMFEEEAQSIASWWIERFRETIAKAETDAKRDFAVQLWEELEQGGTWIGAGETKEYVIPWEKINHILTNQK